MYQDLSRADEITSEVRKLVLTCKALEAQLQQSIPKKAHEDIVAKIQKQIYDLENQVALTKGELEKTLASLRDLPPPAREALEAMTLSKDQIRFKQRVAIDIADIIYNGLWFSAHNQR